MGVSPKKSKSSAGNAAKTACVRPAFNKILHRAILHRGLAALAVLVTLLGGVALTAAAQEDRPQITPGERKATRKKGGGPRALGVLQLGANGKSALVPIAILIDGKFWDASAYKANPIPMALEPGTVYEAERAGSSMGLFTVSTALHSNAANVLTPWIATGAWLPAGSELPKTQNKAEIVPVGIDTSDGPPRLTHNPSKDTPPANAPAPTTPPAATPPSTAPQPTGNSGSGDEPPRLTKSAPPPSSAPPEGSGQGPTGQGQSPQGSAKPAPPSDPKPGDAKTTDTKPADTKPAGRPKAPESDSGASEANRPRLRRGKPTEPLPDEEVPGYSKPGAAPSAASAADSGKSVAAAAAQGPVQTIAAISDAGGPEPHSYGFEWLKDEEGERRQQVVALAQQHLHAYLDAQAKAKITPKPAGLQAARRSPASKPKDLILENVQMTAYDLWTNNTPVVIFSAEAHLPPQPAGSPHADTDADLRYSVLLVAYPDIYQNFHKLYVGITDKYHLDITPHLELVDAVDVDGDGRGELLFRETSDAGSGWVVYRATADKLWKMFDSLNPE